MIAAARVACAVRAAVAAAVVCGTGATRCVRVRATRAMLGAAIHLGCRSAHMRQGESSRSMRGRRAPRGAAFRDIGNADCALLARDVRLTKTKETSIQICNIYRERRNIDEVEFTG